MARRSGKKPEVATQAADTQNGTELTAAQIAEQELIAANEVALKEAEEAAAKAAEEQKAADAAADAAALTGVLGDKNPTEPAKSHPEMCDPELFGSFDVNSNGCKDCAKDYTECATACKALKDYLAAMAKSKTSSTATRTRAPRAEGATPAGRIRGQYQAKQMKLNQVGKPGSKGNSIASAIFAAGADGVAMEGLCGYTVANIKSYINYFTKEEGFNVVHDGTKAYDRTEYATAA